MRPHWWRSGGATQRSSSNVDHMIDAKVHNLFILNIGFTGFVNPWVVCRGKHMAQWPHLLQLAATPVRLQQPSKLQQQCSSQQ